MVDIAIFLDDAIQAKFKDDRKSQIWFRKLKPIFDKNFGPDWLTKYKKDYKKLLKNIDLTHSWEELNEKCHQEQSDVHSIHVSISCYHYLIVPQVVQSIFNVERCLY